MKNITKKIVFFISLLYVFYFVIILAIANLCKSTWCVIREDDPFGFLLIAFIPLIPVFIFSLITYKMRDEVFQSWWSFARWFVPVIIVVTFLLDNYSTGGGYLNMAQDFNFLLIFILYVIFIVVSTVKIMKEYKRSEQANR